ncbi:MAG: DUF1667 domain-containing protein [Clostridia bacterium]|nr:DUF1667 domain-containing protein [Clostridia bacterium]MBR2878770.1 DUF1667 domain-containing protein [Clostridia bacterium]MBR2973239.1 DUF1667 domain-containing protein [Clostridia bacterium]MBR3577060.1 DUF1667 domain-containing protein [Clostridia bacterium]
MKKEIICTICPRGCTVVVDGDAGNVNSVEGYSCKRGLEFATAEFVSPVRILTTTVKISGKENDLLPVRSKSPVPKDKLLECMEVIKKASANVPVKRNDVIIANICNTGIDVVATKDVK